MASILAAFHIKRPLDANGSEYVPEAEFTSGTGRYRVNLFYSVLEPDMSSNYSQPKAFRCRIVSRGEKYEEMIKCERTSY